MTVLKKDNDTPKPEAPEEHPLFSGKTSVGMVSGENPRWPAQASGHEAMGEAIQNLGLKGESQNGRYGAPEQSWMVYGPTREQMFKLGRLFGQDSVVYSSGGQHELLYTNGPNIGRYHPSVGHEWFTSEPEDYYTHMPKYGGYLRLNFDWDKLHPSKLVQGFAVEAQQLRAQHGNDAGLRKALAGAIKKAFFENTPQPRSRRHPHAYEWHNEHTDHHFQVASPGVILLSSSGLTKAEIGSPHPHMDGSKPETAEANFFDQNAKAGVNTYAKYAMPYGVIDKSKSSDLNHYPYHGKNLDIDKLVKDHGYSVYYGGGKYGRPDLANRNYNTKHLMVYDPSSSGRDFGTEAYTDGWRKIHELAHALTYPDLNEIYGEGRRIGKLGHHRTVREALRAVHWEWLAAHKQRELSQQIGVHVPDHVFHKELNTIMHDTVHRAVTGKFTEPAGEGYRPFEHKVPLETALGMVREAAHNLGITGMHDLIRKSEENDMSEKTHQPPAWRQALAKAVRDRVDTYAKEMLALRERELKKSLTPSAPPEMSMMDRCPLCNMEDAPGKCKCLGGPLAGMNKAEDFSPWTDHGHRPMRITNADRENKGTPRVRCMDCGAEGWSDANQASRPCTGGKTEIDKNCGSTIMDKSEEKTKAGTKKMVHCPGCNSKVAARENGEPDGHYLGDTGILCGRGKGSANGTRPDHFNKGEFSDKPKEPVKAQAGSGGLIRKLKIAKGDWSFFVPKPTKPKDASVKPVKKGELEKGDFGMSDGGRGGGKASTLPAAPPPAGSTPPKPKFGLADLAAGKAKLASAGVKPISPLAAPRPAAPPAGTAHLKPPAPAPAAVPGAKPTVPGVPPMSAPAQPRLPKPMGKSEDATVIKSELGQCAICKNDEHPGSCG